MKKTRDDKSPHQRRLNKFLPVKLMGLFMLAAGAPHAAVAEAPAAPPAKTHAAKPFYWSRMFIRHIPEVCARDGENAAEVPAGAKDLWQNLQTLRKGALLGPALAEFSRSADIYHCPVAYERNTAGAWADNDGLVRVAIVPGLPDFAKLSTQAHELTHAVQRTTGVTKVDRSWTIAEFQMNTMAYEAAAHAAQDLIGLEMRDAGLPGPWKWAAIGSPLSTQAAEAAYAAAAQGGLDHAAALSAAGAASWQAQFRSREWADGYNNLILAKFADNLVHGHLAAPSEARYDLARARRTGWISPDLNFTAGIGALPAYADRFAGNTQMRAAFDYLHLEHVAAAHGRQSKPYLAELQRLEEEKNPYLGVDLSVAVREMRMKEVTLSPLEVMNCLAGVKACHYGGEPLKPEQFKINMRPPGVS
jgi:hypothetical protein